MSWLTGKLDVNARWPHVSLGWTNYFLPFSLFALLVMNFDRYYFGDILSYLSSNIGNEEKTFNPSCNTDHRRNNFGSDVSRRLCYFLPQVYVQPGAVVKNTTIYIYRPSGRNQTCGPVIPVQRSNQLSYRVHLDSST